MSARAPRILVFGPAGQVGWELLRSLQPLGDVRPVGRSDADLARPDSLEAVVDREAPAVIVNAAAYTAVDRAEQDEAAATLINGDAPGALARAARRHHSLLIHYSTDYVFAGDGDRPWQEDDPVAPPNAYGRSKLAGERAVAEAGGDWLIFRTSWVYASRGQNFVRTMLRLGAERDSLRVVDDQIGAPTSARLIADATAQAIRVALVERREQRFRSAIHHLCAAGHTSWHGFAQALFERWRVIAPASPLALHTLTPIPSCDYPTPARRPLNSRMSCAGFETRFGLALPAWQHGLELVLSELAASTAPVSVR